MLLNIRHFTFDKSVKPENVEQATEDALRIIKQQDVNLSLFRNIAEKQEGENLARWTIEKDKVKDLPLRPFYGCALRFKKLDENERFLVIEEVLPYANPPTIRLREEFHDAAYQFQAFQKPDSESPEWSIETREDGRGFASSLLKINPDSFECEFTDLKKQRTQK